LRYGLGGPRNHVLDGDPDAAREYAIFGGKNLPDDTNMSCAKMAEPTKMPFSLWTWVGPRKLVLRGVHVGASWHIHRVK